MLRGVSKKPRTRFSSRLCGGKNKTMRHFHTLIFFLFLFSFLPSAASALEIDADSQFEFAEQYFSDKEYEKAVAEYERFLHFFPKDGRVEAAMHKVGMAYFESRKFEAAIHAFGKLLETSDFSLGLSDLEKQAHFMISESHMKLNQPGLALSNLRNLRMLADETELEDECAYRIGWIYLETASWDKARESFGQISPENRDKYQLERLLAGLEEKSAIRQKSPLTAGLLSIVPGGGYLYCGRYRDALASFLVNGALMYAAYESFENDNEALGGIIGFVELGFYTGNIYGSVASAHKYNRSQTSRFIEKLKENTKVGFSAGREKGFMLSFHYAF